jgi:hypothetical protein
MIEEQEVMERTNLALPSEAQPTKAVLAQTCVGVFFTRWVCDAIFCLPKAPAERHGPQKDKHCLNLCIIRPELSEPG